ncbi:MAG: hypothetical protein ACKOD3_08740 [Phenylobacterium sp.]
MRRILSLALLAGLVSGSASAEAAPPSGALERLLSCRALKDGPERLACFDRESAVLAEAEAGGAVVVMDRAKVEAVRRQAFGFTLPSLEALLPRTRPGPGTRSGREPETALTQIESVVANARVSRDGKWVLSLEDGAVWRQTDTESLLRDPRPGSRVVIKAAAMGSFLLSVDGQRSFRARREQ